MSKFSFFILIIAIIIAIIPIYKKFDFIKQILLNKEFDENFEEKKKYILKNSNKNLEKEIKDKYINLKNDLINYLNNNTYLQYERKTIEKIKDLEKEKKLFEEFEANMDNMYKNDFKESELKDLTDLIDRYILPEN